MKPGYSLDRMPHTHTYGEFRVIESICEASLWEEAGVNRENPCMQRESMQSPHRKTRIWTKSLLLWGRSFHADPLGYGAKYNCKPCEVSAESLRLAANFFAHRANSVGPYCCCCCFFRFIASWTAAVDTETATDVGADALSCDMLRSKENRPSWGCSFTTSHPITGWGSTDVWRNVFLLLSQTEIGSASASFSSCCLQSC